MSDLNILVVAADPLLRRAVTESLTELKTLGEVTAVTPTRATTDRLAATDAVVIAGGDGDARTLKPAVAGAAGAGKPVVFVAVGAGDGGAPALVALGGPGAFSVEVPDLDIRAQLGSVAPRVAAALRRAEAAQVSAGPGAAASAPAAAALSRPSIAPRPLAPGSPYLGVVICIGASTGGTDALLSILSKTPRTSPPIVIVQHMPEAYVGDFAARLDRSSPLDVSMAQDDLPLRMGLAVVAPGGRQLRLRKDARGIWTQSGEADRVGGHCPAVDALMKSAAEQLGKRAIGVVLTGMGRDGADGLLAMREAGARTVAQDEATSIVYGMPKAAFENGAADSVVPLEKVAEFVSGLVMSFR